MRPGVAIARVAAANPVQAAVWALVVVSFVAMSLVRGDDRVWPYLTVVLLCTAIFAMTDRSVGFSGTAVWLLVLTGTLHLMGGLLPNPGGRGVMYDLWLVGNVLRFDQVVHVVGSVAATVASWQMLGTWLDLSRAPVRTQAVLAGLAGLGKGAVNEAIEFLLAVQVPGTFVGGFHNTGWDLIFDIVGVVSAAAFLAYSAAPRRPVRDPRPLLADVAA